MKSPLLFAALALALILATPSLRADTILLNSGDARDNTIYSESGALSNGIGEYIFAGRNAASKNDDRRALLAFDVSSILAGSTINSVTLTLNMNKTPDSTARNLALHQLTSDWGEGTSDAGDVNIEEGLGGPATTGDATWTNSFYNTVSWTTAGGDFDASASATTAVGGNGTYFWTGAGLINDVQAWVDGTESNFGWILIGDEATSKSLKRFASSQYFLEAERPSLFIDFTPGVVPEPSRALLLGVGIASAFLRRRRS